MQAIRQFGATVKQHPLAIFVAGGLLAFVSVGLAVFFGLVVVACVLAPVSAVDDAVSAVRKRGIRVFQRAHVVKTDEIAMRRSLDAELLAVSLWNSRVTKALLAGDDDAARECIAERRTHDEAVALLRAELAKQEDVIATVVPVLEKARAQVAKAERSGLFLVIRKRRAEARRAAAVEGTGFEERPDELARVVADVERAEDEAQAAEELLRRPVASGIADRFEEEERRESLDAELAELKRKHGLGRPALNAKVG